MKYFRGIFTILFILLVTSPVWAGGAAARSKQQGQMMRQKQMMQQQMILKQQAAEQQRLRQLQQDTQPEVESEVEIANDVVEEVELKDIMEALESSSSAWELIIDREAKELVVAQYINVYRQQGIAIRRPPAHYVSMIDSMSQDSPEMLKNPFALVMQIVAIIEYDFDNGQSKDAMARQILGEQGFIENRKRLQSLYP